MYFPSRPQTALTRGDKGETSMPPPSPPQVVIHSPYLQSVHHQRTTSRSAWSAADFSSSSSNSSSTSRSSADHLPHHHHHHHQPPTPPFLDLRASSSSVPGKSSPRSPRPASGSSGGKNTSLLLEGIRFFRGLLQRSQQWWRSLWHRKTPSASSAAAASSPLHPKQSATLSTRWILTALALLALMLLVMLHSGGNGSPSTFSQDASRSRSRPSVRSRLEPRLEPVLDPDQSSPAQFLPPQLWSTTPAHPVVVVGVAGGSGSGKSTMVERCTSMLSSIGIRSQVINLDNYYRDLSHMPREERSRVNFDHPDAIDFELIQAHLKKLLAGKAVPQPSYDFATHTRIPEGTVWLDPLVHRSDPEMEREGSAEDDQGQTPLGEDLDPPLDSSRRFAWDVLFLDGILALHDPELRELFDVTVFIDASTDTRLSRRIRRDIAQRGRTAEGVRKQFYETVEPMHQKFVEPTRELASVIIDTEAQESASQGLTALSYQLLGLVYERKAQQLDRIQTSD